MTLEKLLQETQALTNDYYEAKLLITSTLNLSSTDFITNKNIKVNPEKTLKFAKRRQQGEPIAYILGEQGFWDMILKVNQHTLIPRPESELLVEQAIELNPTGNILELGTGSGAISIAIAQEIPNTTITAIDISPEALVVARFNADKYNISNIDFICSSWFEALENKKYDLIISNPPYICEDDIHLQDLKHEPITALSSGVDGLDDIRIIIQNAKNHLNKDAYLVIEHGYNQSNTIQEMLIQSGYKGIKTIKDLNNIQRITMGY